MKKAVLVAMSSLMVLQALSVYASEDRVKRMAPSTLEERSALRSNLQQQIAIAEAELDKAKDKLEKNEDDDNSASVFTAAFVGSLGTILSIGVLNDRHEFGEDGMFKKKSEYYKAALMWGLTSTFALYSAYDELKYNNLNSEQRVLIKEEIAKAEAELKALREKLNNTAS